jgi:hypothetical protein
MYADIHAQLAKTAVDDRLRAAERARTVKAAQDAEDARAALVRHRDTRPRRARSWIASRRARALA